MFSILTDVNSLTFYIKQNPRLKKINDSLGVSVRVKEEIHQERNHLKVERHKSEARRKYSVLSSALQSTSNTNNDLSAIQNFFQQKWVRNIEEDNEVDYIDPLTHVIIPDILFEDKIKQQEQER